MAATRGLPETRSGTSWQPAEAPLPASSGPPAELDQVACPSSTVCFAFGESQSDLIVQIRPMALHGGRRDGARVIQSRYGRGG
jgi:hypothetical protein